MPYAPDSVTAPIGVAPASEAERTLLEGLFQFYLYDFSEIVAPSDPAFDFMGDGRFPPYPYLSTYWHEPGRWPLLIRAGGKAAGFALINQRSHRDDGFAERNMAEFFVARRFRRQGIAQRAFHQVLALHPGAWEVAVMEANEGARAFWPKAIASGSNVSRFRTVDGDGQHWRGPIHLFQAG